MDEVDEFEQPINAPEAADVPDAGPEKRRRVLKDLALAGAAAPIIIAILSRESAAHAYCVPSSATPCCW